jgi:hypothetical protein
LKVLLAPLLSALDPLPTTVDGDIGWRLLVAAWGRQPASLGRMKLDRLIASGVLGGDAARLLKCVPKEVVALARERAPCAALGLCTRAVLANLVAALCLGAPALPPQWSSG